MCKNPPKSFLNGFIGGGGRRRKLVFAAVSFHADQVGPQPLEKQPWTPAHTQKYLAPILKTSSCEIWAHRMCMGLYESVRSKERFTLKSGFANLKIGRQMVYKLSCNCSPLFCSTPPLSPLSYGMLFVCIPLYFCIYINDRKNWRHS